MPIIKQISSWCFHVPVKWPVPKANFRSCFSGMGTFWVCTHACAWPSVHILQQGLCSSASLLVLWPPWGSFSWPPASFKCNQFPKAQAFHSPHQTLSCQKGPWHGYSLGFLPKAQNRFLTAGVPPGCSRSPSSGASFSWVLSACDLHVTSHPSLSLGPWSLGLSPVRFPSPLIPALWRTGSTQLIQIKHTRSYFKGGTFYLFAILVVLCLRLFHELSLSINRKDMKFDVSKE